jgi:hypothetical protein
LALSTESRKAARAPEWGIAVRLADGSRRYYCLEGGIQGQWGVHESQACRFGNADDAERQANAFQTNDAAKEHLVVRLPQPKRRI